MVNIDTEITTVHISDDMPATITTESVELDSIVDNETPISATEKTLEELLEQIAPLGETEDAPTQMVEPIEILDVAEPDTAAESIDATLEKLAAEYVEKQDEIDVKNAPAPGKISKLKNILPFKKAKREEPGLMGDLFGWAGIAANDDDFSMPSFFTGTSKK
jgi:hypothetical protein